jgi:hypothetical protein
MLRVKILKPLSECEKLDVKNAISTYESRASEDELLPTLNMKVSVESIHRGRGGFQRGYNANEENDTIDDGKHRPGTRPQGCPCCDNNDGITIAMMRPEI